MKNSMFLLLAFRCTIRSAAAVALPGWRGAFNPLDQPTVNTYQPDDPAFGIKVAPDLGPVAAEFQETKPTTFISDGARRIKVRYGPYKVPGIFDGDLGKQVENTGGLVWNLPERDVAVPCHDCIATFVQPGLEDQTGNEVNTDKGLWLHHMVTMVEGLGRWDATCRDNTTALPFLALQLDPTTSSRIFPSGNERTIADVSQVPNHRAGFYFGPKDKLHFILEFMNTNKDAKLVWMTMTYEFVPGNTPDFKDVKPIWLDIAQCGLSDVDPPKTAPNFELKAISWPSNVQGTLIGMGGHVHDGGVRIDIRQNGHLLCSSNATYGSDSRYITPPSATGNAMTDKMMDSDRVHVSKMDVCYRTEGTGSKYDWPELKKGDILDLSGFYDYDAHPGMPDQSGGRSGVMAIGIVFVEVPLVRYGI